jgi:LAO/AO transport system kinase
VPASPRPPVDVDALADGVLAGARAQLARAITLVESRRPDHREQAQELLLRLLPSAGGAHRVGITGVPGVGKSTFIDALGTGLTSGELTGTQHRVAVLAVDPSSTRSGGSILGDKTRMTRLANDPRAFVRPSPTAGTLGGVAAATRETMVLVEAAGFDVVLVETVGVGQSEVTVAGMVDCFCFLTLARTGDQLQGIKKGVLELADLVAVNKADGDHVRDARRAARELAGALRLVRPADALWTPPSMITSALTGDGLAEFWATVLRHQEVLGAAGVLESTRAQQQVDWTWAMVREQLLGRLAVHPQVAALRVGTEQEVRGGRLTAALAARRILDAFDGV